jgi:hypothetical protein
MKGAAMNNLVAKAFFAAASLAFAAEIMSRATSVYPHYFNPEPDLLALIGLGILGYFAFDRRRAA